MWRCGGLLASIYSFLVCVGAAANNDVDPDVQQVNSRLSAVVGVRWELVSYGFDTSNKHQPLDGTRYTLFFDRNSLRVDGTIDCNYFDSHYLVEGDTLAIAMVAPTQVACSTMGNDEYQAQHMFVVSTLKNLEHYEVSGVELILTAQDSAQLVYVMISN